MSLLIGGLIIGVIIVGYVTIIAWDTNRREK